jgi:pimeloyl-ACP methyl ester carboxylesterase
MKTIQSHVVVDGVSLSVKRMGRGALVVCLCATGHDAGDFEPLAERLGDRFEFICIEWPGHGESGDDSISASAERYAELVEGVLWQESVRTPIVIGNSIGGATALLYASRQPVSALVLCNSAGLLEVDKKTAKACALFAKLFAAGTRGPWWYQPLFAFYYRLVLPSPSAASQRQRIVARARQLAPSIAQAWQSFGRPEADLRQLAANLTIPIWVAWANRDWVIRLKACLPAIRRLKHGTIDTFDAGHVAFLEQPDAFAEKFVVFAGSTIPMQTSAQNAMSSLPASAAA